MSISDAAGLPAYSETVDREIAGGLADINALASVGPDDETLLLQLQSSNMEALSLLFHRYFHLMLAIARGVLHDQDEAEDLIQDVFLFLLFKGRLFDRTKGSARAWITQITYHRAIDRRRYLKVRSFYDRGSDGSAAENALPPRTGDNLEEFLAWQSCLRHAFEELSEDQRTTLILHFYHGYTMREIASELGQPFGRVQHHFYRGLDRLRKHVFHNEQQVSCKHDQG